MTELIEKYKIEYNPKHKILYIHKAILVKDFIELKRYIKTRGIELNNIIVEGR